MKDFQRGGGWKGGNSFGSKSSFGGGRPKFGGRSGGSSWGGNSGRSSGGYGNGEQREMHDATCNECGNSCQVPFRPNGRKPVYCTNCFKRDGDMAERRPQGGNDYNDRRPSGGNNYFEDTHSEDKRMFSTKCDTCGNACEVPFRPTGKKPIFCHNCFGKGPSVSRGESSFGGGKSNDDVREELRLVNAKLDTILEVLSSLLNDVEEGDEDEMDDDEFVADEEVAVITDEATETEDKA